MLSVNMALKPQDHPKCILLTNNHPSSGFPSIHPFSRCNSQTPGCIYNKGVYSEHTFGHNSSLMREQQAAGFNYKHITDANHVAKGISFGMSWPTL